MRRAPPGNTLPPPPQCATPCGRHALKGQCRVPTPAGPPHGKWAADPGCLPQGPAARGGRTPNPRRPSQRRGAPPPGTPSRHPHSAHAGPQKRTLRGRCWVSTPTQPAPSKHGERSPAARPKDGQLAEGERLTPDAPQNGERSPPGATSHHPRGTQQPAGHAHHRDSAGSPQPHARRNGKWASGPDCLPRGQAAGGG